MRTLLDGEVDVHYWQMYVESGSAGIPDLPGAFAGQANGICGAAVPHSLFLITGLHTGTVGFRVELHDAPPRLDEEWEDVVEVSFRAATAEVALLDWDGAGHPLDLEPADYRVRYCASGMDEAREQDTRLEDEPALDRYLLQFWPAPPAPDRVIRQTSEAAKFEHGHARGLLAPAHQDPPLARADAPPGPPLSGRAEEGDAELRARLPAERAWWQAERARQERLARFEERRWGGRQPTERLRKVGGNALGLARLDRDLVDAIADADPALQRAIAGWAARRAYTLAGIAALGWVAPALAAAERGQALPPPFDDRARVWQLLHSDRRVPRTTVVPLQGGPGIKSQQHMAVPALFAAVHADPLQAALDSLYAAVAVGGRHRQLLDEVRRTFGVTSTPR